MAFKFMPPKKKEKHMQYNLAVRFFEVFDVHVIYHG